MTELQPQNLLKHLFEIAVDAVSPAARIPEALPPLDSNTCVVGAGKASAAMAKAIEDHRPGQVYGTVLTRYGHGIECKSIEIVEAAHPVPDSTGLQAAGKIKETVAKLEESDLAICLISGGASALLTLPHEKIRFSDKQSITRQLLASGADIAELNCVRKHLSGIKGGNLMAHISPARALTLCISDVAGDVPSVIGSGPTVADHTTCHDALGIISEHRIEIPGYIRELLARGELETPDAGNPIFERSEFVIIARPQDAFSACIEFASRLGIAVHYLGDSVEGDTNEAARMHAALLRQQIKSHPPGTPILILSGGETTVKICGDGKGGPNTQFTLALAMELNAMKNVYAIACDTDGIDGSEDNAGARIDPTTLARAEVAGLNPSKFLNNNDSYSFFKSLDDLIATGPTLTNVNDFRAVYFAPN